MTIGLSMSFDPAHCRLRKKAASKLKQNTAEQLEHETKKMEGRIRALKEQMVKEKEEREKHGGTRWTSSNKGGPGPSTPQHPSKKKATKSDKGPRKIKLLSDEPLATYSKKNVIRESLSASFGSDMRCGQCDKTKATLACVECTENYCVGCFMSFHRKGALRNHQTRNLDQVNNGSPEEKGIITDSASFKRTKEPDARRVQNGVSHEQKVGGSLLQGTYDEKESSASFAHVLNEWRSTTDKENTWVNPADNVKVSSVSCETSTSDQFKPAQINLNFGTNKHMSYLDRLVLKKHREGSQKQSVPRSTSRGHKRSTPRDNKPAVEKSSDDFGINYREIFQSIGVHSARQRSSSSQNYHDRTSITIEEVLDNTTNTEETTSCIIEENPGGKQNVPTTVKTTSGSGRVSILGMTPQGDFREDFNEILPPSANSAASGSSLHSSLAGRPLSRLVAQCRVSSAVKSRVWSPKPTYTGLSDFFLAGVKSPLPSNSSPRRDLLDTTAKRVTPKLLARGVWIPEESVCITDVTTEKHGDKESSIAGFPVIPLVQEPSYDTGNGAVKQGSSFIGKGNSVEEEEVQNMQDFGIVDFLKAGPVPRKLSGDYYDVHRVSTVSPLTLTPNPPQFQWSDDDGDDIVDVASQDSDERISRCEDKKEQDDDDRVTLEDLAWELASTTGRLTQCEGELEDSLTEDHEEGRAKDSCDEDSIEENNGGVSLGDESSDDVDEIHLDDSLMIDEVHALK